MPSAMQANGAAGPLKALAPIATLPVTENAGSARDKLRQLKELLDDGLIVTGKCDRYGLPGIARES